MENYEWKIIISALTKMFLYPIFIMLLWNWVADDLFGLPHIGYWVAWGLNLLVSFLRASNSSTYLDEIIKRLR